MKKHYITPSLSTCATTLHAGMLTESYDFDTSDGNSNEHGRYTDTTDEDLDIGTHKRGSSDDDSWGNIW